MAINSARACHHRFPTDHRSLQKAFNEVLVRIAANKLDVHRAGLILYSLQVASQNLSQSPPTSR